MVDGCVYELYFEESMKSHNKEILKFLQDLPCNTVLNSVIQVFDKLFHPEHPVRQRLETMDTVPELRIIEGK